MSAIDAFFNNYELCLLLVQIGVKRLSWEYQIPTINRVSQKEVPPTLNKYLKEYYEIVGESRPLSAFFPTHTDFFTEMHFYS